MKTSRSARSTLLIGTAKGGFALEGAGRTRTLRGPFLFGAKTHDLRADARDGHTWLMSSTGGHLGPTIYRSIDRGRTWTEARHPPRFATARRRKPAAPSVKINFWLEPGHVDEPGVWYCGSSPQGLFRSEDGGETWRGVDGWNRNPAWESWTSFGRDGTPDGPVLHSIQIDPRDARHMTVSCSSGGTFESLDQGRSWRPLNRGISADFLPGPDAEYGHDPHCMRMHPADPDRWYQQNHCGIYRLDRAARAKTPTWTRIGKRMPKDVGDIGFPIVPHPTDADTVWVIPMDGRAIWPRTSVDGRPAVYVTRDGGRSWRRQERGFPRSHVYWTVLRQAFTSDGRQPLGLYFGTTSGEIWASRDAGGRWQRLLAHLPRIYSVRWSAR